MQGLLFLCLVLWHTIVIANNNSWSGNLATEYRYFFNTPSTQQTYRNNFSIAFEPEYFYQSENRQTMFTFKPFLRIDENDHKRTHADIRELYWHFVNRNWEVKVGINKVFWGTTETLHLVDIINQTDVLEDIDQEDKLGQAMINITWVQDWGLLDLFILPGFRERNFPSRFNRPNLIIPAVSNNTANFESDKEKNHTDLALRWSHNIGMLDIGIAYFSGTSREPRFNNNNTILNDFGETELIPIYDLIDQASVDLQATTGSWLIKMEAISRSSRISHYNALVAGVEYTAVGLLNSTADLGLVVEYLYDDRGINASTPFNDDFALGTRIAFNDTQSSEILIALIHDLNNQAKSYFIEGSRRLGNQFKLNIDIRGASNTGINDRLLPLQNDRFIQLGLTNYF